MDAIHLNAHGPILLFTERALIHRFIQQYLDNALFSTSNATMRAIAWLFALVSKFKLFINLDTWANRTSATSSVTDIG